ncbi:MAG TPA: DUF933 domain-containing protein, partial [Actinomycetota bacterium]|nr:DUF933 domain-containing protein [Actinomycetota bacterium]
TPAGTGKANVAVVKVPDPRLDRLTELLSAAKATPAQVRLVDVPGLSAQSLGEAREADALAVVVRAFGSDADPARDLAAFRAECAVADLSTVERSIDRLRKKAKAGAAPDAKAELEVYERAEAVLGEDRWLVEERWAPDEAKMLRNMGPLTLKPVLHVANVDETWDGSELGLPRPAVAVRGLLEAEAAELDEAEAAALMEEFGVSESAMARFVHALYELLDLISFFTGNEKEARAWEIPRGTKAPRAAGQVHTDFEKGFIRWEAVDFEDFMQLASWDAARSVGKLRVEGRDYEVRDGDVVRILHS